MKTFRFLTAGIFLFLASTTSAQVSVNVNIGAPPPWAPVGYERVNYYYLPDVECYYDVHASNFIYFGNGRWIRSRHLPPHYRNYDLYHGRTVVLTDYHGHAPYRHFKQHRVKYVREHAAPHRTYAYKPSKVKVKEKHHHGHGKGNGHGKGHGRDR